MICAVTILSLQLCIPPSLHAVQKETSSTPYYAQLTTQQEGETRSKVKSTKSEAETDQDTGQTWFGKYKWWILAGFAIVAGGAAAAGGGGGGGGGGEETPSSTTQPTTGTYKATW